MRFLLNNLICLINAAANQVVDLNANQKVKEYHDIRDQHKISFKMAYNT